MYANLYIPTIRGWDCIRNNPEEFSDSCSRITGVCPWHRPSWMSGGRRRSSTSSAATTAAHSSRHTRVCMWRVPPLLYTHTNAYLHYTYMNRSPPLGFHSVQQSIRRYFRRKKNEIKWRSLQSSSTIVVLVSWWPFILRRLLCNFFYAFSSCEKVNEPKENLPYWITGFSQRLYTRTRWSRPDLSSRFKLLMVGVESTWKALRNNNIYTRNPSS